MIELQGVKKTFLGPNGEDISAVDEVDLQIQTGETVCLIGTSGSGKTTTMKLINRLIEPSAGTILVEGQNIQEMQLTQLRRRMGYVLQSGGLFPHRTVEANIGLLCQLEGWSKQRIQARVETLLDMVHLPYSMYAKRYPLELSGGQRQRVGVARALALNPPYILMDEPFGALDPVTRSQIHTEFLDIKQKLQKTIIIVTHDIEEAFKLSDRIAVMHQGKLVHVGSKDSLLHSTEPFVKEIIHTQSSS